MKAAQASVCCYVIVPYVFRYVKMQGAIAHQITFTVTTSMILMKFFNSIKTHICYAKIQTASVVTAKEQLKGLIKFAVVKWNLFHRDKCLVVTAHASNYVGTHLYNTKQFCTNVSFNTSIFYYFIMLLLNNDLKKYYQTIS